MLPLVVLESPIDNCHTTCNLCYSFANQMHWDHWIIFSDLDLEMFRGPNLRSVNLVSVKLLIFTCTLFKPQPFVISPYSVLLCVLVQISMQILTCMCVDTHVVDFFSVLKINFCLREVIHYTNIHTDQYLFYYTESYFIKSICVYIHFHLQNLLFCILCAI